MCLHDGYASISPVTDQSEHSILISIEQILISIERSARYELVLVPVDGHTVLGYRTSAAVAGGKRAAWAAGDKVDGRLSAVAGGAHTRDQNGDKPSQPSSSISIPTAKHRMSPF